MLQVLLGSVTLSAVHAAIPNHWLPLVAIGRAERWTRAHTLRVTALAGAAHTASTIMFGLIIGAVGYQLAASHGELLRIAAAATLATLGLAYLVADIRGSGHHHHRQHTHHGDDNTGIGAAADETSHPRRARSVVLSLSVAMFFSPCLEIEAYYLAAGLRGWPAILLVSVVYFAITVLGMVALVALGLAGAGRIRSHFLEHHERGVTGVILVALGAFAYALP